MKQKKAFDIQYKFLHLSQPALTYLKEIGLNDGSIECVRCNGANKTQKHWLFSCVSSYKGERLHFIYNLVKIQQTEKAFFRI